MTGKANLAASIRARLLAVAKAKKVEFELMLTRFALERLLYRLSISAHRERFLLKGALLFDLWFDEPHRPTRDADFLGFGPADLPTMEATFREPEFRVSLGLCWRNPVRDAMLGSVDKEFRNIRNLWTK